MDMSMTMATTTTAMAAMTSTASSMMSTSTAAMDMTTDDLMTSSEMAMVFFQSVTTPLYTMDFMPTGSGSYAGICIFLIVLGTVHRVLMAVRHLLQATVWNPPVDHCLGGKEDVDISAGRRVQSAFRNRPFRVATETSRAAFEVIIGGISYLL
jgi:copper transporter 1